ncbi:uncharacterized protein MELLADRAFT_91928 [Melampsora larici-populina 98AG31]|uniref:RING-CH-type domain-containing protein n=1 Tax=Melampsora larici-populina (strain 98AG31 / pathotype 3-4-7) TaxID=747676 RepID=F4S0X5_MELLP|nr:uncharacterized protein MELLADRAFT_91928 [Melampsora larici-populina 98AG31]EGG01664.1 hypothetical protein MELLADRAFT_91928 [Melampsora larici-populina 98AG31]
MSNSIPSSISKPSTSNTNPQEPTTDSHSHSHSSFYDNFPNHVESYSDELPPDSHPINHEENHHHIPGSYLRDNYVNEPHPRLMMRGTTGRHSHPSSLPNQSRSRPRPSEPISRPKVDLDEPRKCWICYDDEEPESLESDLGYPVLTTSASLQLQKKRKWVKPCRCSLVAHESCLLTWVTTYQLTHSPTTSVASRLSTPVTCPQCAATYHLAQPSSHLLTIIDSFKRPYDKVVSWSALGCVLLGFSITTSSYGLWASRCFLGQARWNNWIVNSSGHFSFSKLFQLSLVGPILLLSRTTQLDSIIPFLPISLVLSNLAPSGYDSQDSTSNQVQFVKLDSVFPPGPALTLCLIPWARIGWNWIWSRITYVVLAHEYKSLEFMDPANGFPSGLGLDGGPRPALVPNAVGRQAEEANGPEDQRFNPLAAANDGGRGQLGAEVVLDYTTLRGAIRMGMEALLLPGAASMAGNMLLLISKHLPWLRTVLGIRSILHHSYFSAPSTGSIWYRLTSSIGTTISRITGLRFWNPSNHQLVGISDWRTNEGILNQYKNGIIEDPIWWRNTLGGALIVLVKDVMGLIEKVLKIRKLSQRRILDVV